jgi:hypothetical protein
MYEIIVMFAITAIFSFFLLVWFSQAILELLINLPLIWISGVRSYIEINVENRTKAYMLSLLFTGILFVVAFGILDISFNLPVWIPTLFIVSLYVIAQPFKLVTK